MHNQKSPLLAVATKRNTLLVEPEQNTAVSPWVAIAAVAREKQRVTAVTGNYGTLAIEHAKPRTAKDRQAHQSTYGGVQR